MRLGAHVFGYTDPESWALKHVAHGYGAAYFPLRHDDDPAQIEAYADAAKRHGLAISEIGAWNNLLDRDPNARERNLLDTVQQLKLADRLGAHCCVNIAGSLGEAWDGPHPDNLTQDTFAQIVAITQRIIDEAQPKNTYYTLEPMPWLYPNSIDSLGRLIAAVNRPAFGVHVDMCNMVDSFDKVYHTGELVKAFFRAFGPLIRVVHAKDTVVQNRLTLRIAEAIPGDGVFDYDALLTECARLRPDLPVMAEHLDTEEQYVRATDFIGQRARALGLALVGGK